MTQRKTPGFNFEIPEKIMTPDTVETRIGRLEFVDGVPTAATTAAVYDHLDFLRGVEVFLNFIPATSMEGLRLGNVELGATRSNQVADLRPAARFGAADADGEHRYRLLQRVSRPRDRRADRRRDPAGLRPGYGQRCVLPLRHRHGDSRTRPRQGRQVPHRSRQLRRRTAGRRLLRFAIAVVRELADPAGIPGGRQAGRGVEDVPGAAQGLSVEQGGQPAGDGVHQLLEGVLQHHPRQRLRVLRRARSRHPEGAARLARPGAARARRQHRHPQGPAVRARRPDEEDAG